MSNGRKLHLDLLRIIAAYFVIFNHTFGFSLFLQYEPASFDYWINMLPSVICKISVPVFFMISGALLLKVEEESGKKQLLRILRIVIALVIFSFLSYLQQILTGAETFDLVRFFQVLVRSDWLNAYWYLYAYLGYLLCLPFLRAMTKVLKPKHYGYLMSLYLVFHGVIPVVLGLLGKLDVSYNDNFSAGWLLGNVPLYPLLGYYLEHKVEQKSLNWLKLIGLWCASILCVGLTCYAVYLDHCATGGFTQNYLMAFVPVPCATVYLTAKKLLANCNKKKVATVITSVGSCTFGIYLMHGQLLRTPQARLFCMLYGSDILSPMAEYLLLSLDVMLIAFGLTWILKKIPLIKKLV